MLKARADDMLIFGVEEANLVALKAGKPIYISLAPVGLPQFTMLIYYGADEAAVLQIFQEKIVAGNVTPNTEIHTVRPS